MSSFFVLFLKKSGQFVITLLVFWDRNADISVTKLFILFFFILDKVQLFYSTFFFVGGDFFFISFFLHCEFFHRFLECFVWLFLVRIFLSGRTSGIMFDRGCWDFYLLIIDIICFIYFNLVAVGYIMCIWELYKQILKQVSLERLLP